MAFPGIIILGRSVKESSVGEIQGHTTPLACTLSYGDGKTYWYIRTSFFFIKSVGLINSISTEAVDFSIQAVDLERLCPYKLFIVPHLE